MAAHNYGALVIPIVMMAIVTWIVGRRWSTAQSMSAVWPHLAIGGVLVIAMAILAFVVFRAMRRHRVTVGVDTLEVVSMKGTRTYCKWNDVLEVTFGRPPGIRGRGAALARMFGLRLANEWVWLHHELREQATGETIGDCLERILPDKSKDAAEAWRMWATGMMKRKQSSR